MAEAVKAGGTGLRNVVVGEGDSRVRATRLRRFVPIDER
jgi:hypothetical protein